MATFLSIALLIIGTAATLSAFGGKTWREGTEPILDRITPRGWISLTCLLLALLLGIGKEVQGIRDKKAAAQLADAEKAKDKAEAEAKQAALLTKLAEQRTALAQQGIQFAEANRTADLKLADAQSRLKDTKATLLDLRQNLHDTHEALSQENTAVLISALGNANRLVKDIKLFVPVANSAARSGLSFNAAFTPDFGVKSCQEHTTIDVLVETGPSSREDLRYDDGDTGTRHKYFLDQPYKVDALTKFAEHDVINLIARNEENAPLRSLKVNSDARYAYNLQIRTTSGTPLSAALVYKLLSNPQSAPFHVFASWPDMTQIYPPSCVSKMQAFFRSAFDRAALILVLDGGQNETIVFRYKAQKPLLIPGELGKRFTELAVDFKAYSTPVALAGFPDVEMADDWPDARRQSSAK